MLNNPYFHKYLKYKQKYLELIGGAGATSETDSNFTKLISDFKNKIDKFVIKLQTTIDNLPTQLTFIADVTKSTKVIEGIPVMEISNYSEDIYTKENIKLEQLNKYTAALDAYNNYIVLPEIYETLRLITDLQEGVIKQQNLQDIAVIENLIKSENLLEIPKATVHTMIVILIININKNIDFNKNYLQIKIDKIEEYKSLASKDSLSPMDFQHREKVLLDMIESKRTLEKNLPKLLELQKILNKKFEKIESNKKKLFDIIELIIPNFTQDDTWKNTQNTLLENVKNKLLIDSRKKILLAIKNEIIKNSNQEELSRLRNILSETPITVEDQMKDLISNIEVEIEKVRQTIPDFNTKIQYNKKMIRIKNLLSISLNIPKTDAYNASIKEKKQLYKDLINIMNPYIKILEKLNNNIIQLPPYSDIQSPISKIKNLKDKLSLKINSMLHQIIITKKLINEKKFPCNSSETANDECIELIKESNKLLEELKSELLKQSIKSLIKIYN